jgi:hypothetical protein
MRSRRRKEKNVQWEPRKAGYNLFPMQVHGLGKEVDRNDNNKLYKLLKFKSGVTIISKCLGVYEIFSRCF